jgi:hypothetical protein
VKKSSAIAKSSTPVSTGDPWLPRWVLLPAAIGLVVLIGVPWLLETYESKPPPQVAAAKDSKSSSSQSQLGRVLSPSYKPPPPPLPRPSPTAAAKGSSIPFMSLRPAETGTEEPSTDSNSPDYSEPGFQRPLTAPNGAAWPEESDYVEGYEQEDAGGLSTVTIDNSRNPSDVFLKLVALQGNQFQPVRVCYIKAFEQFVFSEVAAGNYDVRFQNLTTGEISASAPFILRETPTDSGMRYSNYSLTLYNVANGNMKLKPIKDTQF